MDLWVAECQQGLMLQTELQEIVEKRQVEVVVARQGEVGMVMCGLE